MNKNKPLLIEIVEFLKETRAWWLAPAIILLGIISLLIIIVEANSPTPLIYILF
jgi:hypothetical protein